LNGIELVKAFEVTPVPKPRMTSADKYLHRPIVQRYWRYKDALNSLAPNWKLPDERTWLIFVMPITKSWTKKKKALRLGQPHQQKPDKDNLEKGFLDAWGEDKQFWDGRSTKVWGKSGSIYVLKDAGGHDPLVVAQHVATGDSHLYKKQLYSC
jgi:Holliday junction resolvase RusA-like endonuclease